MARSGSYDEEAARREPLLGRTSTAGGGGGNTGGGSRGLSPARTSSEDGRPVLHAAGSTPRETLRAGLTKRLSNAMHHEEHSSGAEGEEPVGGLVLKDQPESDVRELEVEVVAGAVAEAVAEAVQEAVQEAVHDAVQQAIEEGVQFDVRANVYTLIAVTGVILFWRGVWNTWDVLFGTDSLASNLGSLAVGMAIMLVIRIFNLPLVEGLPGG